MRSYVAALLSLLMFAAGCQQQTTPPPSAPPPAEKPAEPPPPPEPQKPTAPAKPGKPTREAPPSGEPRLRAMLEAKWEGGRLALDYTLESLSIEPMQFQFANSGRVCGTVADAGGKTLVTFPEITAQVMGELVLAPGEKRTFRYEVARAQLGRAAGPYTVEVTLCGRHPYEIEPVRVTVAAP